MLWSTRTPMTRMARLIRAPGSLLLVDVALAVAFAAAAIAVTAHGTALTPAVVAVSCLIALPLAGRRLWSIPVLAVTSVAAAVYAALNYPGGPIYLGPLIALFTVATKRGRSQSFGLAAASLGVIFTGTYVGSGLAGVGSTIHLLFLSWAVAVVFIGDAARSRGRYIASLHERARQAEETREMEAQRRVAEERVRIARDLHDIVGHALATITVQAAAGERVFEATPEQSRETLRAIRETSKRALRDLRGTLDLLRANEDAAPLQPPPGLADISPLLDAPVRAGLRVETAIDGVPYDLGASIDLTAYRVLQEALTNVVRHARASEARVRIRYRPAYVELEVTDNGEGPSGSNGHGHGLEGMRERVASVGGSFAAGLAEGGSGFRVWTRIPTEQAP